MKKVLYKPALVLAVDPGLSGAVVVCGRGDMTIKRDFRSEQDITAAVTELIKLSPDYLVMELAGARPGQGVCSTFSFGKAAGVALGALQAAAAGKPIETVAPLKWKGFYRKHFGIQKGCEVDSRVIASHLFPQFAAYFKRKKDHNSADAFLIALWKLSHL
jgi:crossover junction endodeoxyribonuclease RuvC